MLTDDKFRRDSIAVNIGTTLYFETDVADTYYEGAILAVNPTNNKVGVATGAANERIVGINRDHVVIPTGETGTLNVTVGSHVVFEQPNIAVADNLFEPVVADNDDELNATLGNKGKVGVVIFVRAGKEVIVDMGRIA